MTGIGEDDFPVWHPGLLVHRFLPDTTELVVGFALANFLGNTPQELIGKCWLDRVPEEEKEGVRTHLDAYTPEDPFGVYESTIFDAEGRGHWIRWFNHGVFDIEGHLSYFQTVGVDLTGHKHQVEKLKPECALAYTVVQTLPDLFYMFDSQDSFLLWNREVEEISGYSPEEISQMQPLDFISEEYRGVVQEAIERAFQEGRAEVDAEILTRSGECLPYLFKGRRAVLEGETVLNGFAVDIRERKRLEEKVKYQATHDYLTNLRNRGAFEEALTQEIQRAERHGNRLSLLMLDVDHFKMVNDIYGHAAGDEILQGLSAIMRQRLRGPDVPARWGGEEFMVILPETNLQGAHKVAEDLREAVEAADFPSGAEITISVGAVQYRRSESLRELTKRANEALFVAKETGRNCVISA